MKFTSLVTTKLGKSLLTLTAVSAVGTVGAMTTFAGLKDAAPLPTVAIVQGGTLDINATGKLADGVAVDITNMKPGETLSSDLTLKNDGSVRAKITATGTFQNASECFTYKLAEGGTALLSTSVHTKVIEMAKASTKTLTLSVSENDICDSADGDGAQPPTAELDLAFDAIQLTGSRG